MLARMALPWRTDPVVFLLPSRWRVCGGAPAPGIINLMERHCCRAVGMVGGRNPPFPAKSVLPITASTAGQILFWFLPR